MVSPIYGYSHVGMVGHPYTIMSCTLSEHDFVILTITPRVVLELLTYISQIGILM